VHSRAALFFDLYCADRVPEDAIDDFVEAWHSSGDEEDRPLSRFPGLTEDEYSIWVMDGRTLPLLRAARCTGEALVVAVDRYVEALRKAADPADRSAIHALSHWLRHGPPASDVAERAGT
jgi:hypothetical protein